MAARPAEPALLVLRNLSHRFGARPVLSELSFSVHRGEIFGLLGPNGCGKSTTLRVIAGLLVPDAGELFVEGEPVAPGGRALRRRMGVVFQSPSLDQRLSARENLELCGRLQRVAPATVAPRIAAALELAQLADRADDLVLHFSGGMRRRLELARALLHDPALLVMDEPTSGLDEVSYRRAWERIVSLRGSRGLSVLLTTHRADEAARCDRVAIVDRGRVVAQGTPEQLVARVSGDVLTLETDTPEVLAAEVTRRFSLQPRITRGQLVIERERGHELIPRLVEALPAGSIRSLSMHKPTLADVFVQLTGRSLGQDDEPAVLEPAA